LGFTEHELLGLRYPVLTHPDDLPESRELIRRLLAGEIQTGTLEKRYLHRDGHVVWSKYTATLLRDAVGQPLYFVYHLQDITAHKQAEEALRASEGRLRTVLGRAPVILFALDTAGVVTLCEGQGLAVLGLAPGAVVGQPAAALYRDDPDVPAHIRRALAGADSAVVSQVDGAVLDTRLVPLRDAHGAVQGVIGVATDVTERVRAEAAERAVQARDEFLSVAAHELKTPLTSLGGFAQLLLDYLTAGRVMAPERSQRVLHQIASQTDKVNRLVDHLLDVTRLEAGRLTLERRETDLARRAH
jgi:PAS domain S-box-containing protein